MSLGSVRTVLLLSDKSSGSTALQAELLRHPEVRAVGYTMHNDHETLFWVKAAALVWPHREDFAGGRRPLSRRAARRDLRALLAGNVPNWSPPERATPEADRALVWDGWRALSGAHGPVFFEKSPHHLHHWAATALLLRAALASPREVRVVGLVRNPMAVLYSAWTRWLTPPGPRQHVWLRTARNLLAVQAALGPDRVRLWRYEDLVTRPAEEVRAMTDWLGLAPEAAVGSGLHARSARRWAADPEFSLALDPAVAAVAERLGYAPADLHNPPKPGRPLAGRVADAAARRVRTARGALSRRVVRPLRDRRA